MRARVKVLVRIYILTERERKILKRYLENGEKHDGFRIPIHYLRNNIDRIQSDLDLVKPTLKKINSE